MPAITIRSAFDRRKDPEVGVDLRLAFPNRPGVLLEACTLLAEAGINLEGFCGDIRPGEKWGYVHLLFEDAEEAIKILDEQGIEILDVHDVEILDTEHRPGALAELVRSYTDRGENIEVVYTAADNRIVIGTEAMRRPISGVRVEDASYPNPAAAKETRGS
jgi:hypothetical protein